MYLVIEHAQGGHEISGYDDMSHLSSAWSFQILMAQMGGCLIIIISHEVKIIDEQETIGFETMLYHFWLAAKTPQPPSSACRVVRHILHTHITDYPWLEYIPESFF